MNLKETLQKLRIFEDTEQNPDPRLRATKLRNKAEDLGLKCTSISGSNGTTTLSIYIDNNKPLYVTVFNDGPTKFEYAGFSGYQDDVIKLAKVIEIAKAL